MRHAKSDWPQDVADHERPLAKRGRRDAPRIGRWLGESGYAPGRGALLDGGAGAGDLGAGVVPAWRRRCPVPRLAVRYEPRVYEATVLGLLMLARELDPGWRTALVVGHNPGLAELTVGLAGPDAERLQAFPTAFAAVLGLPGPWADVDAGRGRAARVHRPGRPARVAGDAAGRPRPPVRRHGENRRLLAWNMVSSSSVPTAPR